MTYTQYFINQCKTLVIMIALIAFFAACGGGKEKVSEDLQKAFNAHKEAIKIRQKAGAQLEKLTTDPDSSFMATYQSDLDSIRQSLEAWDDQLVEVPGFEEEHDHSGHDHDHDHHHHGEAPELSPEQHLEVQQHLLSEIKIIAENINQIDKR